MSNGGFFSHPLLNGNGDGMKDISKLLKTCKWCYQIFLIEDTSNHLQCMKKRNQVTQRRKRSIKYDKTGGQRNDRTITSI
jgi:hypothetical protein